ncbi:MAG: hypothetical protein Solivirus2_10 [Solivirus sp.]|uniref:Uncharacterized protein n=1 Tax=Solivirus sp. TaxID=2487772 RepID=A0A3G5AJT1_9VIRU|nr:MAG: hypothetical protein Solivirus2_10 [Solivirus sp.]
MSSLEKNEKQRFSGSLEKNEKQRFSGSLEKNEKQGDSSSGDRNIQLNFIPTSLPIPEKDLQELKRFKSFSPLKLKQNLLNKRWTAKNQKFVIPNFRVSLLFEDGEEAFLLMRKDPKEFKNIIQKQNKKLSDVITKALMENFQLTSRDQLEYSWLSPVGNTTKINSSLKSDTIIIFDNIIIDADYEIDFWISCVEVLLRYK